MVITSIVTPSNLYFHPKSLRHISPHSPLLQLFFCEDCQTTVSNLSPWRQLFHKRGSTVFSHALNVWFPRNKYVGNQYHFVQRQAIHLNFIILIFLKKSELFVFLLLRQEYIVPWSCANTAKLYFYMIRQQNGASFAYVDIYILPVPSQMALNWSGSRLSFDWYSSGVVACALSNPCNTW